MLLIDNEPATLSISTSATDVTESNSRGDVIRQAQYEPTSQFQSASYFQQQIPVSLRGAGDRNFTSHDSNKNLNDDQRNIRKDCVAAMLHIGGESRVMMDKKTDANSGNAKMFQMENQMMKIPFGNFGGNSTGNLNTSRGPDVSAKIGGLFGSDNEVKGIDASAAGKIFTFGPSVGAREYGGETIAFGEVGADANSSLAQADNIGVTTTTENSFRFSFMGGARPSSVPASNESNDSFTFF